MNRSLFVLFLIFVLAACGSVESSGGSGSDDDPGGLGDDCTSAADCEAGLNCIDGVCTTECAGDMDCPTGARCDTEADPQVCVPDDANNGECAEDADCTDGFCEAGVCTGLVCEPGTSACEGNNAVVCNDRGSETTTEDCGDALCVDGACRPEVCPPLEVGCVDGVTAFVCDETGTERTDTPCGADEYCLDGECLARVCEPDTVVCEDNVLIACDELGAEATTLDCDETPECVEAEQGCACVAELGLCREILCEAGTSECVGEFVRTCNDTGTAFLELAACGDEQLCIDGACLDVICTPDGATCAGDTLEVCDSTGTLITEVDCQADLAFCDIIEDVHACTPWVCQPGALSCEGNAIVVCDERGAGPDDDQTVDCGELFCVEGECVESACSAAEALGTAVGCEFWSLDLDNIPRGQEPANGILLMNVGEEQATATIEDPNEDEPRVEVVGAGDALMTAGGAGVGIDGSVRGTGLAIHVTTDQPTVALQYNTSHPVFGTGDVSLLLPTHTLGTEYIAASWSHRDRVMDLRGFVTVLSLQADTTVVVVPASFVVEGDGVPALEPGEEYEVTLAAGEFINLETAHQGADLTGTVISSDAPVVVFGGHECANIPLGRDYCDHIEAQLPPVSAWGNEHVHAQLGRRNFAEHDVVRIIASEEGTTIETEPGQRDIPEELVLGRGEYVEVSTSESFVISSSAPVQVVAYTIGGQPEESLGDPAMVVLPPVHSWQTDFPIHFTTNLIEQVAVITAPVGAEVLVDGGPIRVPFLPVGNSGFVRAVVEFEEAGRHNISSDVPISAVTVGHARNVTYAVPSVHSID